MGNSRNPGTASPFQYKLIYSYENKAYKWDWIINETGWSDWLLALGRFSSYAGVCLFALYKIYYDIYIYISLC